MNSLNSSLLKGLHSLFPPEGSAKIVPPFPNNQMFLHFFKSNSFACRVLSALFNHKCRFRKIIACNYRSKDLFLNSIPPFLQQHFFKIYFQAMRTSSHFPSLGELCGGFLHLLYPDLCVACQQDLPVRHSCFCLRCQWKNIPFDLSNPSDNACTARLWGRLPVQWGSAAYHFTRKSPIQKALHHLKYHNKPDIGVMIGRELGKKLLANPACAPVDAIVPVPLHPKRERLRGYNQSTVFAQGLSDAMNVPLLSQSLLRCTHTATQTNKKRMERFQNVGEVFTVQHEHLLKGKHLLLVDDVLTTGATLEMCGLSLLQVPDTRLSIATIAIADR